VLTFSKYHGLGNDFIVVLRMAGEAPFSPATVRMLCDRNLGIGADGVLSVCPDPHAFARMQIQNADGSESRMCGNGLRCVARFLYDQGQVPSTQTTLILAAGGGLYRCERLQVDRFRIAMGQASFAHPDLPAGEMPLLMVHGAATFLAVPVHVGNPHAIIFVESGEPMALALQHGPVFEGHPAFPQRVNVSFARATPDGFESAVFERGVGLTRACGSGAVALAAAATRLKLWPVGTPMQVHLPGGPLTITTSADGELSMEGEAVHVFDGQVRET